MLFNKASFYQGMLFLAMGVGLLGCQPNAKAPNDKTKQSIASTNAKTTERQFCHNERMIDAYRSAKSNIQVRGCGQVVATLPDDNKGNRHQKFIVRLENSKQTVLIAHNINLAPKIKGLKKGDVVEFYGEYEYSEQGGVVHWTHKDSARRHQDGYILYAGRRFD